MGRVRTHGLAVKFELTRGRPSTSRRKSIGRNTRLHQREVAVSAACVLAFKPACISELAGCISSLRRMSLASLHQRTSGLHQQLAHQKISPAMGRVRTLGLAVKYELNQRGGRVRAGIRGPLFLSAA